MLDALKCVFIIIGTIIGAGFASGQEIASFFNRYGKAGYLGIIISMILFGVTIFYILYVIDKKDIKSFGEFIKNNKFLKLVQELFLFVSYCIMIAGIGAFFEEQLGFLHWAGALLGTLICFLIFSYKYKGLELFNIILVPIIIVGILYICCQNYNIHAFDKIKYTPLPSYTNNYVIASFLYFGYNSLILIPILFTFKSYCLNNKQKTFISIFSFIILLFVGIAIYRIIDMFFPQIMVFELPTLKIASLLGKYQKAIYGIIILFAIFTTAISSGFAFLEMNDEKYNIRNIVMCILAFFISNIGFSHLVNGLFPIFGYVGIVEIIWIIYNFKKMKGYYNE